MIILSVILGGVLATYVWLELNIPYYNDIIACIGALLIFICTLVVGILLSVD